MSGQQLSVAVRAHLEAGRKLDAIRTLRAETGLDLTSSLERVEAFIRADPTLAARHAARQAVLRGKARWVFMIAAALVLCAAWLVFGNR